MDNSQNPVDWDAKAKEQLNPVEQTHDAFKQMSRADQLKFIYTYQPPREDQIPKFIAVQAALLEAAKVVEENCPPCADRSHTLRLLRDARMWANAAIALDGVV